MSYRPSQFLKYKVPTSTREHLVTNSMSREDIEHLFLEILNTGVHGFCFSLYEEGQKPGDIIPESQIRRRLEILKPHTSWIRSFSTTDGNDLIPILAKEMGLKTLVGAWICGDDDKNQKEIENLVRLSNQGFVDIAAVGNEVLYRGELTIAELVHYLEIVRQQIGGIPVGYVDAYYEFTQHEELVDACDVILSNCYPYWEGTSSENAIDHIIQMYNQAHLTAKGKRVIITETGWPSQGKLLGNAQPGFINSMRYFIETQLWAFDQGIDLFYFSSFDESWKVDSEGEVGAYWGIWDKNEKLKLRTV